MTIKKVLFILVGVLLLTGSSYSYTKAEKEDSDVPVPTKSQRFVNAKKNEIRAEIKERVQEVKASKSAALADSKRERVGKYWERLKNRLLALIERQEKLLSRISSRVEKIESEEGENLDEVKEVIADAQKELEMARVDLAAADESLESVLESNDPKEAFKAVRDTVYEIRRSIISVHTRLAQIIGNVRGLRKGGDVEVSVTATPTVTLVPTATVTVTPTP